MRIVEINMLHYGSTGNIMLTIANHARNAGHEVRTFSPNVYCRHYKMDTPPIAGHKYFGFLKENMVHTIASKLFCVNGCLSVCGTHILIKELKKTRPEIIHLHNLHNKTMCFPLLFRYIRRSRIKVVWTIHDCWTMTGRCAHFTMAKCEKWKSGCGNCPQIKDYPRAYVDLTHMMWRLKKKWFASVEDMVIVTPSEWLAGIVQESYLQKYPVKVINNGIDLDIFKPTESDFRQKYHCEDKKIVLGVSMGWSIKKGLDTFVELASRLPENYQIVLVGGDEQTERLLPSNVISIHKTQNQQELAEIYTVADVFVNPTREDTFPTVNIESLICGTPVITFRTGGSPEIIDETCGSVVECDDVEDLEREIIRVCNEKPYSQDACINRARQFDQKEKFKEYIKLYEDMVHNK